MRQKSLAYYFLNGALNVKPATRYMEALNDLMQGIDSKSWGQGYITALQLYGFVLSTTMPEADERLYPHDGLPMCAMQPPPNDVVSWPPNTYIVWDLT